MSTPPRRLVGVVGLGSPRHGIRRYGEIVGGAVAELDGFSVVDVEADFAQVGWRAALEPIRVAWSLRHTDAVIVSYCSVGLWAPGRLRLWQAVALHLGLRRRTVAVLHDVYDPGSARRSEWWSMALHLLLASATIIHGEHDRQILREMPRATSVRVVPHFIEPRSIPDRDEARDELGVDRDAKVVAMLGWIHPRKNYEAALAALARLPGFELWLIGEPSPGNEGYRQRLQQIAATDGVEARLTITGYVSEDELDRRLAAIDIGLCPYHSASASASMSSLLAARRPVAASAIPFAEEVQALAPQAVALLDDTLPESLAAAVAQLVENPRVDADFDELLRRRAPHAVAGEYARILTSVGGQAAAG